MKQRGTDVKIHHQVSVSDLGAHIEGHGSELLIPWATYEAIGRARKELKEMAND